MTPQVILYNSTDVFSVNGCVYCLWDQLKSKAPTVMIVLHWPLFFAVLQTLLTDLMWRLSTMTSMQFSVWVLRRADTAENECQVGRRQDRISSPKSRRFKSETSIVKRGLL